MTYQHRPNGEHDMTITATDRIVAQVDDAAEFAEWRALDEDDA